MCLSIWSPFLGIELLMNHLIPLRCPQVDHKHYPETARKKKRQCLPSSINVCLSTETFPIPVDIYTSNDCMQMLTGQARTWARIGWHGTRGGYGARIPAQEVIKEEQAGAIRKMIFIS